MLSYSLYFLIVVGLSIVMTAAFKKFREGRQDVARLHDDAVFHRKLKEIEEQFSRPQDKDL